MALPNVFTEAVSSGLLARLNQLSPASQPQWGKMNVAQMLAHCNVTYELAYENKHPRPNALMRLILKTFVKKIVVGEKPYAQNGRTAPVFIIAGEREFAAEKDRLAAYIAKTQQLGQTAFEGKENPGFGKMTATEWNNLFYKHLDHHFRQFGV
jgi:PHD/YefM family antitoxin component YafN of YafNO toxin-antitoxin module